MSKHAPTLLETMSAAIDLHREHQRVTAAPPAEVPDAVPRALLTKRRPAAWLPMRNNNGGSAPPLTLLKRKETPMASFSDLIKSADALIALDKANHFHFYGSNNSVDDDEDDFESPSDPSNDYDDDEDDNGNGMKKADEHYHFPHYGGTSSPATPASYGRGPDLKTDTYQTDVRPATRAASTTSFDDLVQSVIERDGCSKNEAMATARRENPAAYQSYQASVANSPTNEQHTRRAGRGVGKRMPDTFEDLVSNEMLTKGVNWRTAEQRIINTHGSAALARRMTNSENLSDRFAAIVKRLSFEHHISMEEATRMARHRNPHLYKAMRSI
jgi:hypothetical protein